MAVIEFTDSEKEILEMLFKIGFKVIEAQDGYIYPSGAGFDRNDFYELAEKLGVEEYY